ncbi:MAG: response regulator transcription factor [Candidatus Eisenbacteria bacterium]|uniref:Response regulator transcription factor n=1 Tax=Eiseniibacteriota bacterium TaxID=2212470 RepID=A0A948RXK1_UNCEI|nr:response regulator transcription factor [Candidatus Eisenbacteria bacterium]MBU1947570.1 response regulator transcription factor [Candidatus Eisenbacteria bacterium]MBU2692700.1 response regulator transcription factor [Candidatus Eisenbacteria bacterium]
MRILIAEDDLTSRRILETVLKKWGHEVISTSDGEMAWVEIQKADAPSLIILDWMMPGMDGVEICYKIRKADDHKPRYIILLTAKTEKKDIVQGLDAGANDFVSKPFNRDELEARINVGRRVVELEDKLAKKVTELQEALNQVKTLQGIIPICMHCHKIRDDQEAWQKMEEYVEDHSGAEFSHSLCPECLDKYYPADPDDDEKDEDKDQDKKGLAFG